MRNKLTLYDLAAAEDDRRFSPCCWRTKMALAHKGLPHEAIPWRFTEKDAIAASGQGKVPVLVDGGATVADSWAIALHLEKSYPHLPSLFGGSSAMHLTLFINDWVDRVVLPALAPILAVDILAHLHPKDRQYFRATREKVYGRPLEEVSADRATRVVAFRNLLEPLRTVLRKQSFVAGDTPAYADYVPFAAFQWARCISPFKLLDQHDPISSWRLRMLDTFDGLAHRAPGYPV
ncbi:MAG: glutathione S-transferase family protein [Hyphomonadaceae bacterium]|nr:glutathione S-transferase family protein [Hyphomonadaceae bacterium]